MATDKDTNVLSKTEYISREAALYIHCVEADRGGCVDLPENGGYCRPGNRYCEEGKLFDNYPAADVRPVVRSRWIEIDDYVLCANCGTAEHGPNRNFCHDCGADMREEVSDNV